MPSRPAPRDPLDAALDIAEAFERAQVSYAIGGALAYGIWAVPRATVDVDVNLFVADAALPRVFSILRDLGISLDEEEARARQLREGMFLGKWGYFRIDLFTPSIDFSWEAERTRVRHTIGSREAWFLSAEAIAVFKLLFFRPKDLVDLERLVAVHAELDVAYVRRQIAAMMGAEDPRVAALDDLAPPSRGSEP